MSAHTRAHRGRRALAATIDYTLLGALAGALGAVENKYELSTSDGVCTRHAGATVLTLTQTVQDIKRLRGNSYGYRRAGLRVLDQESGKPISLLRASVCVAAKRGPSYLSAILLTSESARLRKNARAFSSSLKDRKQTHPEVDASMELLKKYGRESAPLLIKSVLLTRALKAAVAPVRTRLQCQTIVLTKRDADV